MAPPLAERLLTASQQLHGALSAGEFDALSPNRHAELVILGAALQRWSEEERPSKAQPGVNPFDPAAPAGTLAVLPIIDTNMLAETIRVPGGWVLRTLVGRTEDGWDAIAQTFIPLPESTGRG